MHGVLTREQAAEVFGEENLLTFSAELLPDSLAHEPTRNFLLSVGFPNEEAQGLIVPDTALTEGMRPIFTSHFFTEYGWDVPEGCEDHLLVGELQAAVSGLVAIDAKSGAVNLISELDITTPTLLNTSISELVYFLYVLRRDEDLYSGEYYDTHEQPPPGSQKTDTFGQAAERIRQEFQKADPAALEPEENIWLSVLEDISTGVWT